MKADTRPAHGCLAYRVVLHLLDRSKESTQMKTFKLNRAQKVLLASLIDKISIGYFAAVGGVAWLNTDLFALHAVALFTIMQAYAVYLLKGDDDSKR